MVKVDAAINFMFICRFEQYAALRCQHEVQ